jgi:diadenosine tetraphosphate (Ap4A) HIT family hydrolase
MSDCIFCKIVGGAIPSTAVYEDDVCYAFLDINPITPGHTLVIPKQHAPSLTDLAPETAAHMMKVARRIAGALKASDIRSEGVNLHLADGAAAGQEIFHVHLHVFPRYAGDGFGLKFPPEYGEQQPQSEREAVAQKLRRQLDR